MNINIAPLRIEDHARWIVLARGYKTFYKTALPDTEYDKAWRRLLAQDGMVGLGATRDEQLLGIAHYLFHTSVWAPSVCYLQDLFVDPPARGKGIARALIEAVAANAKARDATRFYWLTQEHNETGRALYDKVAKFNGFIRYDFPLD
ncbi:MAG: GNAT family N-acetyltransferase [Burkholderiales bacterium]|nr:GNAT family N-acetyltransferase [Burkholderiales bacterium]